MAASAARRKRGDEDTHSFFRKGVAGDWQQWLSAAQRQSFAERAGELMKLAGYGTG